MLWFISLVSVIILYRLWRVKMDITEVQQKLTDLDTSVKALIALPSNPAPVDLQPLGDQIDAIKAEVDAKLSSG